MSNTPLPEPWDYCYEWDGPFGTRKFSTASHNGSRPDRSVPLYTADQLHSHATAVTAAKDAEIQQLRADNIRLQNEVVMPLRERVRVLEDALRKACDDMEGWGLYAPEYFREKHDFVGDVEAARAALGDKTP